MFVHSVPNFSSVRFGLWDISRRGKISLPPTVTTAVELQRAYVPYDITTRGIRHLKWSFPAELVDIDSLRGCRVLDIGIGKGQFLKDLIKNNIDAIGIDKQSYKRSWFYTLFPWLMPKRTGWVGANACHLPFRDEAFDVMYSTWSLFFRVYFLNENPKLLIAALQEMYRVLCPGGKIRLAPVCRTEIFELIQQAQLQGKLAPSQFDNKVWKTDEGYLLQKKRPYWIELEKIG